MPPATARPGALQTWLQPPATSVNSTKRKRDNEGNEEVSSVNSNADQNEQVPAKRTQKKSSVKLKVVSKPKSSSKATAKPASLAKEAKKLHTDKIKEVEKRYLDLDKKVKAMSPNSCSITVGNYAISAAKHVNVATKLIDMGTPVLAFNFVMALADASHRRISSHKMSGDDSDCCEPFVRLDEALSAAIAARESPPLTAYLDDEKLPPVPHRFTEDDADVGEFKTGRPNKQQRGWLANAYIDWEKARRLARRERRDSCDDWVRVALDDLLADHQYLDDRGIGTDFHVGVDKREENSYFSESIKTLQEMIAGRWGHGENLLATAATSEKAVSLDS
ncbi:hypothetical protein LTR86_005995 [Recurvomyces mirabilis]|nr:hypothetical protein LTR86_005995 [Recurvomyces mirabilis]